MHRRKSAYFLVGTVLALLVLGIVMLFSTSAYARDAHGNPNFFVQRQIMWMLAGIMMGAVAAAWDYHFWQKTWWVWFSLAVVLLALCFVPHIGMKVNGSRRWIHIGPLTSQPSELGKFAAVAFLAFWFSKYEADSRKLWKGFAAPLLCVGVLMGLIAREVDLGTTTLIGCTVLAVMFVAGTHWACLGSLAGAGLGALYYVATHMPQRMARLMAFMHPEQYHDAAGYQQYQGLIAFGSGGAEGLGLGLSRQKLQYLPFAHTDFILPVVGEELGLLGTLGVVFAFLVITLAGTTISLQARDRFGMLLGFGITVMLAMQAAVNIGVTTSLLPNKGLPLPFISYGGSNLAFCLVCIGILVNIFRHGAVVDRGVKTNTRLNARVTPRL
jgi:cell division protein FtsW